MVTMFGKVSTTFSTTEDIFVRVSSNAFVIPLSPVSHFPVSLPPHKQGLFTALRFSLVLTWLQWMAPAGISLAHTNNHLTLVKLSLFDSVSLLRLQTLDVREPPFC